jgi:SAM-dependent methyltransferase
MNAAGRAAACAACARHFEAQAGVLRFLDDVDSRSAHPLATQYREVRTHDGHRRVDADYYRALPSVPPGDPHAAEWRIRQRSFQSLQRHVMEAHRRPMRVADLGAGCGWLTHRLTALGHDVVAVDRLDDELDGLGVRRHYPVEFTRVQADFDRLPFDDRQFDVAVFNASLHYSADPDLTLAEARRVLAPGGALAVVDSPMFGREADGRRMVADELARFERDCGVAAPVPIGVGFLTFERLDRTARRLGMAAAFVPTRGPLGWRLRRRVASLRLGRRPAAFGVWVAR